MATSEEFTTQEVFESAVSIVRNLPKEGAIKPSDELKLKLYAYYKQAVHGPNDTPKPRFYQLVELYKWDAWKKLGDMSREEAMLSYIGELKKIMESIPDSSENSVAPQEFEDVLGKKFYDYWFKQWKQSDRRKGLNTQLSGSLSCDRSSSSKLPPVHQTRNYDTQGGSSSSSENSSISLLEESQSIAIDEEGYKTPTSLATAAGFENLFVGQASDQYAAAILRLQKSLDETNLRLDQIESRINNQQQQQSGVAGKLANQGRRSGLMTTTNGSRHGYSGLLINLLKNIKSLHWFYLSYPVLIYFVMRSMENRRKSRAQNLPR